MEKRSREKRKGKEILEAGIDLKTPVLPFENYLLLYSG
jgi:hypothetical protein